MLNGIVDNYEQCGQQSIVQSSFHEHGNTLISFSAMEVVK